MKKTIAIIGAVLVAVVIHAQSPTPSPSAAPIVVPTPAVVQVEQPVTIALSPAQVQGLVTTLATAGITLPAGIKNLNLRVITTGTNAGGAIVNLRF